MKYDLTALAFISIGCAIIVMNASTVEGNYGKEEIL